MLDALQIKSREKHTVGTNASPSHKRLKTPDIPCSLHRSIYVGVFCKPRVRKNPRYRNQDTFNMINRKFTKDDVTHITK